jgi:hypothetical protein
MNELKNKPLYQKPIARNLQAPSAWGGDTEGNCYTGDFVGGDRGLCYSGGTPNLSGSCHSGISPIIGDWCFTGNSPGLGRCDAGSGN